MSWAEVTGKATKVKFGDVVHNANLVEKDPVGAGIERIVGLEHLDPENLHIRRWGTPEDGTSFSRKFVPGQTLFGKRRAYQRKVAFAEFEGICSGDILTFESKDPEVLLPDLLPFICQTDAFFDHALGTSAGSLSPRTSWNALAKFEFLLPPLEEQKRIAEILWAADQVTEAYRRVSKSCKYLQNVYSLNILAHGRGSKDSVGTELGLPENWALVTIKELVVPRKHSLLAGPFGTIFKAKDFREQGVPIVQLRHVTTDGFVWGQNNTYMDFDVYERLHTPYTVKPGDLLITKLGDPPGMVCLYPENMEFGMVTPDIVRARLDTNIVHPRFLLAYYNSPATKTRIMQLTKGGTRPRVSLEELFDLKIPLPPMDEQKKLVSDLEEFDKCNLQSLEICTAVGDIRRYYLQSTFCLSTSGATNV